MGIPHPCSSPSMEHHSRSRGSALSSPILPCTEWRPAPVVSQATVCPGQRCLAELQAPGFQGTPGPDEPPCSALEPIAQSRLSPCPELSLPPLTTHPAFAIWANSLQRLPFPLSISLEDVEKSAGLGHLKSGFALDGASRPDLWWTPACRDLPQLDSVQAGR